jgi:hypothetical protein
MATKKTPDKPAPADGSDSSAAHSDQARRDTDEMPEWFRRNIEAVHVPARTSEAAKHRKPRNHPIEEAH